LAAEQSAQKRLGNALFYGIAILLVYLVYLIFEPFLVPLAWAVVLVVFSYPAYKRLARRWNPTAAAAATTLGVMLILIVPTLLVMAAFVRQGVDAARSIQLGLADGHFARVNELWMRIQERFPDAAPTDLATLLQKYAEQAAGYLAAQLGTVLKHTAVFLFHLSVAVLAMFYLFRDGDSIVLRLHDVLPFEEAHRERMLRDGRDLIFASITSSVAAAAAHGVLGGVAFSLTGIHSPIFWGVMMGFFSLVPVVGSAMIWVPAAISLMAGGHMGRGIFLIIICGVIVGVMDNVVRPWLIGGRSEMGGLLIFISVLGGIAVFGMLGIILGPIIIATGASLLDLYAPSAPGRNKPAKPGGK
jgi:predicted PurR-regulated permease PerM